MKDEKNPAQELREKLFAQPKHAALRMSDDEISAAFEWCEGYKSFLDENRTEREITAFSQKLAESRGFEKFDSSKNIRRATRSGSMSRRRRLSSPFSAHAR